MLKGNSAVCGGSYSFDWQYVDKIILHDGTTLNWSKCSNVAVEVIIGEQNSVVIDNHIKLHCRPIQDIRLKAKQLLAYIPHLVLNVDSIRQFQSSNNEESDSGDEQAVGEPYSPAYDDITWEIISNHFTELKSLFNKAREVNYQNAAGKHFLCCLMRFCCWIDMSVQRYVNVGTCSSGEEQPGCSNLKKTMSSTCK